MRQRLLFAALAAFTACGADNILSGSLSEVFPLDVSKVDIAQNAEAFQVTYLRNRGVFLDVVVRVSVSLASGTLEDGGVEYLELKPGSRVALQGEYRPGSPRTAVTHAPGGEPVRNLPRVKMGDLVITEAVSRDLPDGGTVTRVRGNFSMRFESEGGDVGFGRTLAGNFFGDVSDAGFGELP
jgi:hypothetical protein